MRRENLKIKFLGDIAVESRVVVAQQHRNPLAAKLTIFAFLRCDRKSWTTEIGDFAPREGGVSVEYLQPAHQQHQQAYDVDPMRHPDQHRMPINKSAPGRTALRSRQTVRAIARSARYVV